MFIRSPQLIPVPRVMVDGQIWYSREIGLCTPHTADHNIANIFFGTLPWKFSKSILIRTIKKILIRRFWSISIRRRFCKTSIPYTMVQFAYLLHMSSSYSHTLYPFLHSCPVLDWLHINFTRSPPLEERKKPLQSCKIEIVCREELLTHLFIN